MINAVRETVHDFLEKNNRGWLKPERFNNYAYLAQLEIFESYFYDYARWLKMQEKRNSGSHYANIPKFIREKLDKFFVANRSATYTEGFNITAFAMPSDFYRLISVSYQPVGATVSDIEEVDEQRLKRLLRSNHTAPDTTYPVYVRQYDQIDEDPLILVYPTSITSGVYVDYIREPKVPKWTYNTVSGNPVFNASASDFQDFEIHPSDEARLVVKILGYAGLSIRESDVVQYAEMNEQQKKATESRV